MGILINEERFKSGSAESDGRKSALKLLGLLRYCSNSSVWGSAELLSMGSGEYVSSVDSRGSG